MTLQRRSRYLMRQLRLQMAEMERIGTARKAIAIELRVSIAQVSRALGRAPGNNSARKKSCC